MGRFYTNPFQKDAPTVWQVSATEPYFAGYTALPEGVFADYERTITYSDGTTRSELWERRPSGLLRDAAMGGAVYERYEPTRPGGWAARIYYPGLIEQSKDPVWRELRAALRSSRSELDTPTALPTDTTP